MTPRLLRWFWPGPACCVVREVDPRGAAPLFVVVHGTWARRAPWTTPHSPLLQQLTDHFPGAGVARFEWSGGNGLRHRLTAAAELASTLNALGKEHGSREIYVLSHSHGGNVVAWAATALERPLDGAIYLNTPFIQILDGRSLPFSYVQLLFWILYAQATAAIFASGRIGVSGVALLLLVSTLFIVLQKLTLDALRTAREQVTIAVHSERRVKKELVVNTVGDEVASAFGGVFIFQLLAKVASRIAPLAGVLLLIYAWAIHQFGVHAWDPGTTLLFRLSLGTFACTVAALVAGGGAYGVLQGLIALDTPMTISAAPVGTASVVTVAWNWRDGLRHSIVHDAPRVGNAIVIWVLENRLRVLQDLAATVLAQRREAPPRPD